MFETLGSKTLYQGKSYSFSLDTISLPDGKKTQIEQLHHPGGVVILAVDGDGKILMERQYRYAVKCELVELPAGKMEKGEEPLAAAKREFLEETGYVVDEISLLGIAYPSPGVVTEKLHLYYAKTIHAGERHLDDDEFIRLEWMEKKKVCDMIAQNAITDAKTICTWTLATLKGIL